MRIGYLASHYPAVSHTFVLREIQALRRQAVDVETFSIHRSGSDQLLAAVDKEENSRTYAVLPARPLKLAWAHLSALLRAPGRYLDTLAFALKRANPGLRGRLWGFFYFAEAIVVWRAARRRGVRHLHAVFADVASDVALLVARYGGTGWTWSVAIHGPLEFYDVALNHLAEKLGSARFAVAISDFGRSQLMAIGSEDRWSDMHVVHCGIDPASFVLEGDLSPPVGDPHIVCVGRLVHIKGQSLLLQALCELGRRGLLARATLVGDGPRRAELEALATQLGVSERVTFAGSVGQDAIWAIYRSAEVFCLPSMAEGLPVVLMEAMALEVPVVSTRIMGIPELVEDGVTGLLVAPGRVGPLADALERLLRDPELRARIGSAGRQKVLSDFDVNESARQLSTIFHSKIGPTA